MTRDMELIRRILAEIQSREGLEPRLAQIDGPDEVTLGHHVEMLFNEGLIEGTVHKPHDRPYAQVFVTDLSWAGHDFIAVLQNETVWSQIKQKLSVMELATMPLPILKEVGVGLLKKYLIQKVGLGD